MARARIRSSPRVSPNTQTRAARAASQTTTLRAMARDQATAVEIAAADLETRSSRVRMIKGEAKVVSRSTLTVIGKTDDHFTFHSPYLIKRLSLFK